ncbi:hypothetical protein G6F37_002872 [Rhizopus arrhizus]|nr:hypothetical protein G6F38_004461 [Rhizopus arrhizus]KAG1161664.1 hypothetical protein G6F37_002872 [Rhizopus arrhizus]
MIPGNPFEKSNSHAHLDTIFESVKRQIDLWGENAKWKIDLVLLDNPQQQNGLRPLLSPQQLHPNAITTPSIHNNNQNNQLPVTTSIQYPWDYHPPLNSHDWRQRDHDDLQQKLRESIERQRYLENLIWSQAEQIKNTKNQPREEDAIKTMKNIFLMNENEQKNRFKVETELLEKDIKILKKKLEKMASTLYEIENIKINCEDDHLDKDSLLEDKRILLRKLYLAELRLSARDAELEYLHDLIHSLKSTPSFNKPISQPIKKIRKGPPYLFQQQFSPRSSEVRSFEQHPLSALDSLGIVADQMLSDPEFDSTTTTTSQGEKRFRSRLDDRRSQRSMDSAVTLLTMPQLTTPTQKIENNHLKKPRTTYMRWTEEEDEKLRRAVKKNGSSNWEACAKELEGRTNIQCRNRWIRYLEPKSDARQSPSIAALLNNPYTPPSPLATPKNVKRIKSEDMFASS